jgi:hypothetical protein
LTIITRLTTDTIAATSPTTIAPAVLASTVRITLTLLQGTAVAAGKLTTVTTVTAATIVSAFYIVACSVLAGTFDTLVTAAANSAGKTTAGVPALFAETRRFAWTGCTVVAGRDKVAGDSYLRSLQDQILVYTTTTQGTF